MGIKLTGESFIDKKTSIDPELIAEVNGQWVMDITEVTDSVYSVTFSNKRISAMMIRNKDYIKALVNLFDNMVEFYRVDTFDVNITNLIKRQL